MGTTLSNNVCAFSWWKCLSARPDVGRNDGLNEVAHPIERKGAVRGKQRERERDRKGAMRGRERERERERERGGEIA